MASIKKYLKRAYQSNYLGVQKVGSFFGRGGVEIVASNAGWTTSITTNGTSRVWSFGLPSSTSPTAGAALTFKVGTAATAGHSIHGNYYPKYFDDVNKDTGGVRSIKNENFLQFEILSVGAGNDGASGYYDSNAWQSPQAGSGGNGGATLGQTYTGLNTSYTISLGTSPEPVNILYFRQPSAAVGVAKTGALKGFGGTGGVGNCNTRWAPDENTPIPARPSIPGSGGITSSITGSSLGYGGGGGGGGGASGVNGGGTGSPSPGGIDTPSAIRGTPGVRGGGGGGGGLSRYAGGAGGEYMIIIKSSSDSV